MPRKRGSTAAGISDLPRIAGGITENGENDMTKEEIVQALREKLPEWILGTEPPEAGR